MHIPKSWISPSSVARFRAPPRRRHRGVGFQGVYRGLLGLCPPRQSFPHRLGQLFSGPIDLLPGLGDVCGQLLDLLRGLGLSGFDLGLRFPDTPELPLDYTGHEQERDQKHDGDADLHQYARPPVLAPAEHPRDGQHPQPRQDQHDGQPCPLEPALGQQALTPSTSTPHRA